MFWECHVVTSSIDKLLDQPLDHVTVLDFLNESDLIQECFTQNNRLLDYLTQPNVMRELIGYVTTRPNDNSFHNAQVVSELLSGDFPRIQEQLLEKENLDLLYSFLCTKKTSEEPTLHPILASYFSRIFTTLIIRKPNEILNYFKSCQRFADEFFDHLDSTSVADILYRFIADCGNQRSEAIKWYVEIRLIDGLFEQLIASESTYTQSNIVNLLCEFLRLAFDQSNGIDNDIGRNIDTLLALSATEYLPSKSRDIDQESLSNRLSPRQDFENQTTNIENEEKSLIQLLAQNILSKSNLEKLFDALCKKPSLVENGCDFLITTLDLLNRYMFIPQCISISTFVERKSTSKDENERMQINDEADTLTAIKSNEESSNDANNNDFQILTESIKDGRIQIYLTLLEVMPSRLPSLVALLSKPSPPLIPSSPPYESIQAVKYQFISEPLGAMRLNLTKFFCKLINTISNDCTGDHIYQILNSNRLLHVLTDLFHRHIYNNFLHTQVYSIIRLICHINSLAVKQSNQIWTRTMLTDQRKSSESELNVASFHYTNRGSYKLFQSILTSSDVNLVGRLLDEFELNTASNKSILTSSSSDDAITSTLQTRFTSPNVGHVAQILRCLREYALTFNNYSSFFKMADQEQIDENTTALEIRWETALDYLNDDEKKWTAMHAHDQNSTNSFHLDSASTALSRVNNSMALSDNHDVEKRRITFHKRSFGSSGAPYVDDDDDDDDEVERFEIDDEMMNSEQTTNERRLIDMKKISFEPQFPPVFDEQSLWHSQEDVDLLKTRSNNDNSDKMKMASLPELPDLFGSYRRQHEKSSSSTESSFEQLCSLRANDHGSGPIIFPFQPSSPIARDQVGNEQDEF